MLKDKDSLDINKIKSEIKFINELNFSDHEILMNINAILRINQNLQSCNDSLSKTCINNDWLHETFYRNDKNQLKTRFIKCNKHKNINELNESNENYWIKDFENNEITVDLLHYDIQKIIVNQYDDVPDDALQMYKDWGKLKDLLLEMIPNNKYANLYLYGKGGIGKSYLMQLFANEIVKNNLTVSYVNIHNLSIIYKRDFIEDKKNIDNYLVGLKYCDVLIIDNFGDESFFPSFHNDVLYNILKYRFENKMPTFFISKYSLGEINYYKKIKLDANDKEYLEKLLKLINSNINENKIYLNGYNLAKKGKL